MNIQTAVQKLENLIASLELRDAEEIIATSRDFWEMEDYDERERVEAEFVQHHKAIVTQLTQTWGEPIFEGGWTEEGFPEWATIENIPFTVWQLGSRAAYVAIRQSDKELPFQLVIGIHEV